MGGVFAIPEDGGEPIPVLPFAQVVAEAEVVVSLWTQDQK
jgi:hypothetical protein